MLKNIAIVVLFLFLSSLPVFVSETRAEGLRNGNYQNILLEGIHKTFNLDEDGADVLLKKAVELEPENPTGYAVEAMLHMFAYEMCFTEEQRQDRKTAEAYYITGF